MTTNPGHPPVEDALLPARDGVRLFSETVRVARPVGVVLLTHGLGEHSGRHGHVIEALRERRLASVRYDLRGHGRSEGLRGHAESFSVLLDDLTVMFRATREQFPGLPVVVLGHSLGGNIVANWCLRRKEESRQAVGIVLSAPWLMLGEEPQRWKRNLIRTLSRVSPEFPIPARFRTKNLTRSPAAAAEYEADPLVHHRITTRLAWEAYTAGLWALDHAAECELPLLAVHGTADPITSPEATRKFCAAVPHADLILFEGLVHEPHNEPEWRYVVAQVGDWISRRVTLASRPRAAI